MDKDLGGCWKVRTSKSTGTLCGCSLGHGEHLNVAVTPGWAGSNQDSDTEDWQLFHVSPDQTLQIGASELAQD